MIFFHPKPVFGSALFILFFLTGCEIVKYYNDIEDAGSDTNDDTDTATESGTPVDSDSGFKWVGNVTQGNAIPADFATYWNQITPENEGKWAAVEPSRDNMVWSDLDAIHYFAKGNGFPFKWHTFVWGNQQPSWIDSLPEDQQEAEVEEWITEFCARYPDVDMIDVVNEPDHIPPGYSNALGGAGTTGYDWVIWCFEKAREHCPNATLILNDFNVLRWDTDNFIKIATILHERGLLDAIGCEAHGLESQSIDELESNLDKVAAVGVPVYISEYDVRIANDAQQLAMMKEQFPVFYTHPSVKGITLWGYIQGKTWYYDTYLLHSDDTPRPALTWLMEYLGR